MMSETNNSSISRRGVLATATAGAGVAALGGTPVMAQTGTPKTFVLVHGAWHGGWCWRRVSDRLRKAGHQVFTPTLTGLGERSHLARPDIGIDTHIEDVAKVFELEDLNDVILVGHSYGGMIITGAAEKVVDRLRHLVYLDAMVPQDGQTVA